MFKKIYIFVIGTILLSHQIQAVTLSVENKTNSPVFIALYCAPFVVNGTADRLNDPAIIAPDGKVSMNRLGGIFQCNHYILFSYDVQQLQSVVTSEQFDRIPKVYAGVMTPSLLGQTFHIIDEQGILRGYKLKPSLTDGFRAVYDTLARPYIMEWRKKSPLYKYYQYKDRAAHVRIGADLCPEEVAYITKRKPTVKKGLEKLIGKKLNGSYIPTIAFLTSGGGVRAMISSLGAHIGMNNKGLLDILMYDLSISGSSWFMLSWLQSKKSLDNYKAELRLLVSKGLSPLYELSSNERALIRNTMLDRIAFGQPVTLVNMFGAALASLYLASHGKNKQALWFSDVLSLKDASRYPFPIFSALNADDSREESINPIRANWFEFTPYEVGGSGSWFGNVFVPTWAFGRNFLNGKSQDYGPACDIGFLMGMGGSVFAITLGQIYRGILGAGYFQKILNIPYDFLSKFDFFETTRLSIAKVNNFGFGIESIPYKNSPTLSMADAGAVLSFAYPPVSGMGVRKADVLIFMSASYNLEIDGSSDVKMVGEYAQYYGLKFPKLPEGKAFIEATNKSFAVFKDDNDPDVPLVIFVSRVVDHSAIDYGSSISDDFHTNFSPLTFHYSTDDFEKLSWVTQQNIEQNIEPIKQAILWKISQKGGIA